VTGLPVATPSPFSDAWERQVDNVGTVTGLSAGKHSTRWLEMQSERRSHLMSVLQRV
jgi:hypothetical protein